jgi:hypothetical protein
MRSQRSQALPIASLVLSGIWMAANICPLFYSLLFPTEDIQRIVRALEGSETVPRELAPVVQETMTTSGPLQRAIQVSAFARSSSEYKLGESHTTKVTALSYLAWFEKRQKSTILVIIRTETDGSQIRFDIKEGRPLVTLYLYLLAVLPFAFAVYWFRRNARSPAKEQYHAKSVTGPSV